MANTGQNTGRLVGKDFITAGIFSVLALVTMMVASLANLVPQTYFAYSAVAMLLMAPVYLVFMAKVPKRWSITLFYVVPSLYLCISGLEGIIAGAVIMACAALADLIIGKKRRRFAKLGLAYLVIAAAFEVGTQVRLFLFTGDYLERAVRIGLDPSYIDYLSTHATLGTWAVFVAVTAVAAILGLLLGRRLARRQLKAAGIE